MPPTDAVVDAAKDMLRTLKFAKAKIDAQNPDATIPGIFDVDHRIARSIIKATAAGLGDGPDLKELQCR